MRKGRSVRYPSAVVRPSVKDRSFDNEWHKQAVKLGHPKFERLDKCVERQKLMLSRFMSHAPQRKGWENLRSCTLTRCAVIDCSEACHFGVYRRRVAMLKTGLPLLKKHSKPFFFVTVVHPLWEAPIGQLKNISIEAAEKWSRRRLASLEIPGLISIGGFEVDHSVELDGTQHWAGHIHLVVAGATKDQLRAAFRVEKKYRRIRPGQKIVKIKNFDSLTKTLAYTQKRLVRTKVAFKREDNGRQDRKVRTPTAKIWAECDTWLYGLPLGARIILFGCARRGNTIYARG